MSVVTEHMVYFCAFPHSEIFQKNTRKSGVGRGQFDAGVNGLTILKRKNLSLPLKVKTDQFVICLVLPECLSVKICCISPLDTNCDSADA